MVIFGFVICCPRAAPLCFLDQYIFRCRLRALCDWHDRYIIGDSS